MGEEFRERQKHDALGLAPVWAYSFLSMCKRDCLLLSMVSCSPEFLSGDEAEHSYGSASLYKVALVSLLTLAHVVEAVEWECLVLSVNSTVNCNLFLI